MYEDKKPIKVIDFNSLQAI